MLHRFSDEALEIVYRSEILESRLDLPDLGTGGLLLGLIEEKTNIAGFELRDLDLDSPIITNEVMERRRNDFRTDFEVFESCFNEKVRACQDTYLIHREMGHFLIFPEHIFVSILQMQKLSEARAILTALGVNCEAVRKKIVTKMQTEDRFKVACNFADDVSHSTYFGKLVGLRWETKSAILRQSKDESKDLNARLYNETLRQLRVAEEKASTAKLRPRTSA